MGPSTNNQSLSNPPKFMSRHKNYYIEGADFHIIADKTLFKVHSYFFTRESTTFHRRVHPASPGTTGAGSDKDPILLENVTPEELEAFISVFYNPRYSIYEKSIDEWKVILRLATEWEFNEVKELVARELHKKPELSLVDRLALYEKYQVDPRHLIPLYTILCAHDTPLSLAESKILGLETAVKISSMREKLRALPSNEGRSPLPPDLETQDVFRAWETEIKIPTGSTLAFQQEHGLLSPTFATNANSIGHNLNSNQSTAANGSTRGSGRRDTKRSTTGL